MKRWTDETRADTARWLDAWLSVKGLGGVVYGLFSKDCPEHPGHMALVQYVGLIVFLSMLFRLIGT